MSDDGLAPGACDVRHLTPQQWTALRRSILARAQEERMSAIRHMAALPRAALRGACALGLRAIITLASMTKRQLNQRRRARDLRELSAMDDVALRDIGLSRLDIRAAQSKQNQAARKR